MEATSSLAAVAAVKRKHVRERLPNQSDKKAAAGDKPSVCCACDELGIGMLGLDVWKREQLAQLLLRLVDDKGELDSAALQRRAVIQFMSANADNSSPTAGVAVKDA